MRIAGPWPWYFNTLSGALENAENGQTIQTRAVNLTETLNFDSTKSLSIEGGYDCEYSAAGGVTDVSGPVTIEKGMLSITNLSILTPAQ